MIEKKRGRRSKRPPKEQLEAFYSRMTAKEVGQHYKVAEQTVYAWLNYYRKQEKEIEGGGKIKKRLQAV